LLLGIALALAEECVIQQTSLAPLIGIDPNHVYGRAFGVNWVYLLWALGFESVWSVVTPIALAELMFPARRAELWLGKRGLIIAAVIFALSSFVAWYSWTQVFLPKFFPQSVYHAPFSTITIGLVVIFSLVVVALVPRPLPAKQASRSVPKWWGVGMITFGLALPWYLQILLAFSAFPTLPAGIALLGGMTLAGVAIFMTDRWIANQGWSDAHRLGMIIAVVIATLLGGFAALKHFHK
jgi:apolipoprotein N-acyltransferase